MGSFRLGLERSSPEAIATDEGKLFDVKGLITYVVDHLKLHESS